MASGAPLGGRNAGLTASCAEPSDATRTAANASRDKVFIIVSSLPGASGALPQLFQMSATLAKKSPPATQRNKCTIRPKCLFPRAPDTVKTPIRSRPPPAAVDTPAPSPASPLADIQPCQ